LLITSTTRVATYSVLETEGGGCNWWWDELFEMSASQKEHQMRRWRSSKGKMKAARGGKWGKPIIAQIRWMRNHHKTLPSCFLSRGQALKLTRDRPEITIMIS